VPETIDQTATATSEPQLITAREAKQRVADGAVLLDTRSPAGREKTGAIPGAVIVNRDDLDAGFGFDSPSRHGEITSTDTPIVVICGLRSP
jgi:rhodanese-related sulfurtransferase